MAQEKDEKAPAKIGAIALLNRIAADQEKVLDQVMRDFPTLTRKQALEALKDSGFY